MLLENLALGRMIEIFVNREGYRYTLRSKVEDTSKKRLCVTLIAANNRVFKFRPTDEIKIVYRDSEQMWEWNNVKAGVIAVNGVQRHYFDIVDKGKSFNRRNAYRVSINEDVMLGYYDQYGTTAKSSEMQRLLPGDEIYAPASLTIPKFVKGYVRDVSETGVGICSNYEFSIDDAMFLNISSPYGRLTVRAQVVRRTEMHAARNKFAYYYGCVILQTDNKLIKYIYDIQREAIKEQKEQKEQEAAYIQSLKENNAKADAPQNSGEDASKKQPGRTKKKDGEQKGGAAEPARKVKGIKRTEITLEDLK